jgi:hypothetical protein
MQNLANGERKITLGMTTMTVDRETIPTMVTGIKATATTTTTLQMATTPLTITNGTPVTIEVAFNGTTIATTLDNKVIETSSSENGNSNLGPPTIPPWLTLAVHHLLHRLLLRPLLPPNLKRKASGNPLRVARISVKRMRGEAMCHHATTIIRSGLLHEAISSETRFMVIKATKVVGINEITRLVIQVNETIAAADGISRKITPLPIKATEVVGPSETPLMEFKGTTQEVGGTIDLQTFATATITMPSEQLFHLLLVYTMVLHPTHPFQNHPWVTVEEEAMPVEEEAMPDEEEAMSGEEEAMTDEEEAMTDEAEVEADDHLKDVVDRLMDVVGVEGPNHQ